MVKSLKRWLALKRVVDILLSSIAILMLLPIWLVISLIIFIEDKGPIFYRQKRVGLRETLFTIYKFRSMRVNNIPPLELGAVKHNHSLVTRIGHFIRRTKLDETPQFFNVLRGDMSLIGPRPCLPVRLETMTQREKRRFAMLPGLSGFAEVNGNVELTWQEQLWLDLWYVDHASFWLDCQIFFATFKVVLLGSTRNEVMLKKVQLAYQQET